MLSKNQLSRSIKRSILPRRLRTITTTCITKNVNRHIKAFLSLRANNLQIISIVFNVPSSSLSQKKYESNYLHDGILKYKVLPHEGVQSNASSSVRWRATITPPIVGKWVRVSSEENLSILNIGGLLVYKLLKFALLKIIQYSRDVLR